MSYVAAHVLISLNKTEISSSVCCHCPVSAGLAEDRILGALLTERVGCAMLAPGSSYICEHNVIDIIDSHNNYTTMPQENCIVIRNHLLVLRSIALADVVRVSLNHHTVWGVSSCLPLKPDVISDIDVHESADDLKQHPLLPTRRSRYRPYYSQNSLRDRTLSAL